MTEKRRRTRCLASEHAHIFWTDPRGQYWQENATVIDASPTGLGVVLSHRIEARTQVGLRNAGSPTVMATVRHIRQKGLKFLAGLELAEPIVPSRKV